MADLQGNVMRADYVMPQSATAPLILGRANAEHLTTSYVPTVASDITTKLYVDQGLAALTPVVYTHSEYDITIIPKFCSIDIHSPYGATIAADTTAGTANFSWPHADVPPPRADLTVVIPNITEAAAWSFLTLSASSTLAGTMVPCNGITWSSTALNPFPTPFNITYNTI